MVALEPVDPVWVDVRDAPARLVGAAREPLSVAVGERLCLAASAQAHGGVLAHGLEQPVPYESLYASRGIVLARIKE